MEVPVAVTVVTLLPAAAPPSNSVAAERTRARNVDKVDTMLLVNYFQSYNMKFLCQNDECERLYFIWFILFSKVSLFAIK